MTKNLLFLAFAAAGFASCNNGHKADNKDMVYKSILTKPGLKYRRAILSV